MPTVSILMPVRNEGRYLNQALDSLFSQTLTDWELIAVDDGSTDETPALLADAARRDARVRVISTGGGGLVAALNRGLAACSAPLLARMDGDDICHPRRLEQQVGYLQRHAEIGLVACGFRHFPRSSLKQGMLAYEGWQNGLATHESIIADLFVESPFVHPSVMLRTELLKSLGGYRDMGWPEDYDLWLRMAASGAIFARIPDTLFFWRDHPERATRVMEEYTRHAFRACKLDHLRAGFLKGCSRVVIAGAGLEGRAWQRLLATRGIGVSCWLDVDPRKIGRVLHGAPVHGVDVLTRLGDRPILAAIGVAGARGQFREIAAAAALVEGTDFICVS